MLVSQQNIRLWTCGVSELFPTWAARRIAERLSRESHWIFFSKWQLLFAIKLLCTFGSTEPGKAQVKDDKFLDFLLMTNDFYARGESDLSTDEGLKGSVQRVALQGYSLIQHELAINLIARYYELFGRLAAPANRSEFNTWVDIQDVVNTKLGVPVGRHLKRCLFALCGNSRGRIVVARRWRGEPATWVSDSLRVTSLT